MRTAPWRFSVARNADFVVQDLSSSCAAATLKLKKRVAWISSNMSSLYQLEGSQISSADAGSSEDDIAMVMA